LLLGNLIGELASIVDDLADDTSKVAVALGIIEVSELGRSLVQARVGRYPKRQYSDVFDIAERLVRY
jgi:hypothetical protein